MRKLPELEMVQPHQHRCSSINDGPAPRTHSALKRKPIHREALVSKKMSLVLHDILNVFYVLSIKVINVI